MFSRFSLHFVFLLATALSLKLATAEYDDCRDPCSKFDKVPVCKCDRPFDAYDPQCYPTCVNPEEFDVDNARRPGHTTSDGVYLNCDCVPPARKRDPDTRRRPERREEPDRSMHEANRVRTRAPVIKPAPQEENKCPIPDKDADHAMYCRINSVGDITMTSFSTKLAEKHRKSGNSVFYPGTRFPEEDSLYYDCYCQPQCDDHHAVARSLPIHDSKFTFFHNNTYQFCLAVPKTAIDSEFYFQTAKAKPKKIERYHCKSTRGLGPGDLCNGWEIVSGKEHLRFGHPCYDTWCVHAEWGYLEPYYEPHMSNEWKNTYNGAVVTKSFFKQSVRHGDEYIPVSPRKDSRTFLWSISVSIHVSAHLGDIRVYDRAHILQYKTSESALVTGFGWGPEKSDVNVHSMIDFTTHVQMPLYLRLKSFSVENYKNGKQSLYPMKDDGCVEPKRFDPDAKEPTICKQKWRILLEPEYNLCQLEVMVKLEFEYLCFESFEKSTAHRCPYERDVEYGENILRTEVDYKSEYWCRAFDTEIAPPKAKMESYACKDCVNPHTGKSCATWSFLMKESPYFEIAVDSSDYLSVSGTKLNELKISTLCSADYAPKGGNGESNLWLVSKGRVTPVGEALGLMINDNPTDAICMGGRPETTTRFYFKFNELYFHPPKKLNCKFNIWAELELSYGTHAYPQTTLLSAHLKATREDLLASRPGLLADGDVMAVASPESTPIVMGSISGEGTLNGGEGKDEATTTTTPDSGASSVASHALMHAALCVLLTVMWL
eukprot:76284_1